MSKEFRHITRVAETDLDGTLRITEAITKIKGIGPNVAKAIVTRSGVDPDVRLGFLSLQDLEKLESMIREPTKNDLPDWLFNRRKDLETGGNLHLTGSNLVLQVKTDVDQMKATKSWKGYRHSHGLKARGQRTKTTGRKGKAIGVRKKRPPARGKA
jgi:small subunit ribosomal protein S13